MVVGHNRPFSAQISRNTSTRYAFALLTLIVALVIYRAFSPFLADSGPYIILFPVVAFAAWYCGVGPSISMTVLALVGAKYWFVPPIHSFRVPGSATVIDMVAFSLAASVIVAMGEARRRENDKLRGAQGKLEDRVKERTAALDAANQSLRELSARL